MNSFFPPLSLLRQEARVYTIAYLRPWLKGEKHLPGVPSIALDLLAGLLGDYDSRKTCFWELTCDRIGFIHGRRFSDSRMHPIIDVNVMKALILVIKDRTNLGNKSLLYLEEILPKRSENVWP